MPTLDEVAALVREETGHRAVLTEYTALQDDIGVDGDDLSEFMTAYSRRFHVDVSGFLWYFHTGPEEDFSVELFRPVPHIPITLDMLREFAERGRWEIEYPPHTPPRHQPAYWVCLLLLAACLLAAFGVRLLGAR